MRVNALASGLINGRVIHVERGWMPTGKVYSTEERARSCVEEARLRPGFRDAPDGFEVAAFEVDKDEWTKGYRTADGLDIPGWFDPSSGPPPRNQPPPASGTSR
jgi:hypothetical protein